MNNDSMNTIRVLKSRHHTVARLMRVKQDCKHTHDNNEQVASEQPWKQIITICRTISQGIVIN